MKIKMRKSLITLIILAFSFGYFLMANTEAVVEEGKTLPEPEDKREDKRLEYQDTRRLEPGIIGDDLGGAKTPEYAPNELIVKLKEGKTLEDIQELNVKYNVTSTEKAFKDIPTPQDRLDELKEKLSGLETKEHEGWYWQLDKDSQEYKDYLAKIEKEKEELQNQIKAQEELIQHLEERQKRAPEGVSPPNLENIHLLKISSETDIVAMAEEYKQNPNVEYAEPNYICKVQMVPNDPYYSSTGSWGQSYDDLWGLKKIQVGQAWDITQGEGVIVAVVDTGVDYTHPDINANMWKDSSGNYGYDFVSNDSDPQDGHGHGTHVAGTIAAVGNNNRDIIGVAPKAKIMAVKGLNDYGDGYYRDLANCLKYAADNNADVISNSWGGDGRDEIIEDAIRYAYAKGCVVVVAAGNEYSWSFYSHPSGMQEVICVGATDSEDKIAEFSNRIVDVTAPGVGILSLRSSVGSDMEGCAGKVTRDFLLYAQGTSMACPHISGVCALLLSIKSKLGTEEIRQILHLSAEDLGEPGYDVEYGFGRVNAKRAIEELNKGEVCVANIITPSLYEGWHMDPNNTLVDIKGTATGTNIKKWELSYKKQDTNEPWTVLKTSTEKKVYDYLKPDSPEGLLGNLDINALDEDTYLIKLKVSDGMRDYEDVNYIGVWKTFLLRDNKVTIYNGKEGIIKIKASVWGKDLIEYKLWYFLFSEVSQWGGADIGTVKPVDRLTEGITMLTNGKTQVVGTEIADFDPSKVPVPGRYILVLEAIRKDNSGNQKSHDSMVYFWIDSTLKKNFPIQIETKRADMFFKTADINQDGKEEIVVLIENRICVYDSNGKMLVGWPFYLEGDITGQVPLAVGNMDDDKELEIVAAEGVRIYIVDTNGRMLKKIETYRDMISPVQQLMLANIDNDVDKEIVISSRHEIGVMQRNGSIEILKTLSGSGYWIIKSKAAGDINQDGYEDIVYTYTKIKEYSPYLSIISNNGKMILDTLPLGKGDYFENASSYSPVLDDVNGDGYPEILVRVGNKLALLGYNKDTQSVEYLPGWPQDLPPSQLSNCNLVGAQSLPLIGDIDGDGEKEIIVGLQEERDKDKEWVSNIYYYNIDGTVSKNFLYGIDFLLGGTIGLIGTYDMDKDGISDIILHHSNGVIAVLRADGSIIELRMILGFGYTEENFSICNMDEDSNLEAVYVDNCGIGGYDAVDIYLWDIERQYSNEEDTRSWPMAQHDLYNSRNYLTYTTDVKPEGKTTIISEREVGNIRNKDFTSRDFLLWSIHIWASDWYCGAWNSLEGIMRQERKLRWASVGKGYPEYLQQGLIRLTPGRYEIFASAAVWAEQTYDEGEFVLSVFNDKYEFKSQKQIFGGNSNVGIVDLGCEILEDALYTLRLSRVDQTGKELSLWIRSFWIKFVSGPTVLHGDVDGDGKVTVADVMVVLRTRVGLEPFPAKPEQKELTPEEKKRADVNGDGNIDSCDAILILRYSAGLINKFPVEK